VSSELWVGVGELADGAAQSLRDCGAGALGGPGRAPRVPTPADGRGEVVDQCVEFGLGALGAGEVVGQIFVVELLR
jgi:hypothetical protein